MPLSSQPEGGVHVPGPSPAPDAEPGAVSGSIGAGAAQAPWPQAQPIVSHDPVQENPGATAGESPAQEPGVPLATPEAPAAESDAPAPSLGSQTPEPVAASERPAAPFIATASGADVPASAENRSELAAVEGGNQNFTTGYVGGAVAAAPTQSALLGEATPQSTAAGATGLQPELHGAQGSTAPFGGATATLEQPRTAADGSALPPGGRATDPELIGADVFVRSDVLLDGTHYACANCGLPRYVHSVINARCPGVPDTPFEPPPDIPPAGLTAQAEANGLSVAVTVSNAAADVGLDFGDGSAVVELLRAEADETGDVHAEHEYAAAGDYTIRAFAGQARTTAVVSLEAPPAVAPTLSSIDPNSGDEMATTEVTLRGTGFTSPGAKPQSRLGTSGTLERRDL